jgi:hypothetical protein
MFGMMSVFAEFERSMIQVPTSNARSSPIYARRIAQARA